MKYMDEIVWLLIGTGIGLGSAWFLRQPLLNSTELTPTIAPSTALEADPARVIKQLQQTQAAYHMAAEMSQFKAGFLARTSHELRSPLNGIIGVHQLILYDLCDSPEEEREFLAQANQSVLKMVQLLDQIIEVSKLEHGTTQLDLQPVSLTTLFTQVEQATQLQAANRNLSLQVHLPDPDLYVVANSVRLQQVLLYLVDGAIANLSEGAVQLSCQADQPAGVAYIWVDDTCPNTGWSEAANLTMAAPDRKEVALSPGLNLVLSQALIQAMQGELQPVTLPPDPQFTRRLQCSLPLATKPEPA